MAKHMELTNISDTARWVAMYRVMESERQDAIFHDPLARRLAGTRGEEILGAMPQGRRFAWPMIVRTALFDEIVLRLAGSVDTVLNLAAGLDARPYRLALPPSLRWIDVDLPPMIDYKRELLARERPKCSVEFVGLDLADRQGRRALFARVGAAGKRVLVATEGLLVYLTREQAGELAADLQQQPSFQYWLIDSVSPFILGMMQRTWGKQLDAAASPLRFGPEEGPEFYAQFGWRTAETRDTFQEAKRLRRLPGQMRFWSLLSFITPKKVREQQQKGLSGVALLERQAG
jgi:methyltransferase (TIGR00027 family)